MSDSRPVIICPLAFERSAFLRHCTVAVRVICSGPGADAIRQQVSQLGSVEAPVILVGLAGSLDPAYTVGSARAASEVRDPSGRRWTPPLSACDSCHIIGVDATVHLPADKLTLGERSGAAIVDMESAAFAEAATEARYQWGVVRGISDGAHDRLPTDIEEWVGPDGQTKPGRVMRSVIRRPRELRTIICLSRSSRTAMRHATAIVEVMLNAGCKKNNTGPLLQ